MGNRDARVKALNTLRRIIRWQLTSSVSMDVDSETAGAYAKV
jgi:hypothetical protein